MAIRRGLVTVLAVGAGLVLPPPAVLSQHAAGQASPPAWATRGRPAGAAISVPRFDRILEGIRRNGTRRLIVRIAAPTSLPGGFRHEATLPAGQAVQSQRAALSGRQRGLLARLATPAASRAVPFDFVPFMAVEVDEIDFLTLVNAPEVDHIEEDVAVPPLLDQSVALLGAGGDRSFSGFSGAGMAVAVLDTGVDGTHPFFGGRVVSEACYSTTSAGYSESLCPGGLNAETGPGSGAQCSALVSGCYHGTHVAGISAGQDGTRTGVAKDASVIAIQVFSKFPNQASCGAVPAPCALSFTSDQIAALQRVYALRDTYDIAAVNMSLGGGVYGSPCDASNVSLKAAIDSLRAAGIATVIASGNNGSATGLSSPACISSAVSVGATTKADVVSSFSNSASFLALLAPGSAITSSIPGGAYTALNGTSMAAPHVAGAWAVVKSKKPTASVDEVLMALKSTGVPVLDARNGTRLPRIDVSGALTQVSSQAATILWRAADGRVAAWSMSGTQRTATGFVEGGVAVDLFWTMVAAADLDADGDADLLWRGADGRLVAWFMNGLTRTGVSFLNGGAAVATEWRVAGAADYSGDGRPDILWRHVDGRAVVWVMNGIVRTSVVFLNDGGAVDPAWSISGTPDLNGDGHADILWRHTDGRLVVWLMDRTSRVAVTFLNGGSPVDPQWRVAATTDFNGDGHTDLLWRHADGRIVVWFMNGTAKASQTFLNNGLTVGTLWTVSSAYPGA